MIIVFQKKKMYDVLARFYFLALSFLVSVILWAPLVYSFSQYFLDFNSLANIRELRSRVFVRSTVMPHYLLTSSLRECIHERKSNDGRPVGVAVATDRQGFYIYVFSLSLVLSAYFWSGVACAVLVRSVDVSPGTSIQRVMSRRLHIFSYVFSVASLNKK